jgi:hypothetical protein
MRELLKCMELRADLEPWLTRIGWYRGPAATRPEGCYAGDWFGFVRRWKETLQLLEDMQQEIEQLSDSEGRP